MKRRFTRGLRFRLTLSYALFFTLLIVTVGFLFREYLSTSLDQQEHDILDEEFATLKAYLKIYHGHIVWFGDRDDLDEASALARLQRVFLLADQNGAILTVSPAYESLGSDSPAEIRAAIKSRDKVWKEKLDNTRAHFLVRGGVLGDEDNKTQYYAALGLSLENNRNLLRKFTFRAIEIIPALILAGCVIGWILMGRGLTPVMEVAKTAQRITGSNLSLRIPTRGARDELDFLIETFNDMISRLESSFGQIRQFSTDVSHELRTPITILRGQLEVALFTAETKEQYREAIVDSLQDIERLGQIIRALLLLSQAETGQVVLQRTRFNLADVLRDIVDQFQIPAEGAHVKLLISGPRECEAELDRVQIERMLSNLLSNAIKFTPPGGEVRVTLECPADQALLTIEDTGCGIPEEHLPHIFDRFYRVSSPDRAASPEKGLGLGLSFVAWIVKAHGGTIRVESELDKGTRFLVTLPMRQAAGSADAEEAGAMKKV